ncbi:putative phage abortive infection protein [Xanthobacter autotrophicus]|uniref:putative phage abortive infection protein n=1 Tax=Xanthobacter autotrophicus TaxID=280 RepID=UPI001E42D399|nr:putative phage abortive infection protein [Xanthobacter autotrophicus]UDQ91285.1 putative phage abortive infection protein [Xanthobacter autotrophicus]
MRSFVIRKLSKSVDYARDAFDDFLDPKDGNSRRGLFNLFFASASAIVLILFVSIITLLFRKNPGEFGDLFGGTLSPILSFLTFMGLLITIVLQQQELKETRDELKRSATALESQINSIDKQNFESTFFQMLSLHNTIINSIDIKYSKAQTYPPYEEIRFERKGRDCFERFYENYTDFYHNTDCQFSQKKRLQKAYDDFWIIRQQDLAHYYRYLYNVLRFVHEYDGKIDKTKYIRLLRAQLSDYELALLFYTALNKNGIRYCIYIHCYKLFDNLPKELLIEPSHYILYSEQSFGEPKEDSNNDWPPRLLIREQEEKSSREHFTSTPSPLTPQTALQTPPPAGPPAHPAR